MNYKLTIATALLLSVAPSATVFGQSAAQAGSTGQASASVSASTSSAGTMRVVSRESMSGNTAGDDDQQSVIEVRIDNGKVSVKRNGKEVPQDQIRHEDDGRIIILDENGKAINNMSLFGATGGKGGFTFRGANADGQANTFWVGDEAGEAPKVMLGVHMTEPGAALEKHLHLQPGKCVMITGVFEGLPAEVAGLGEYDVIVSIDGNDDADAASIRKALSTKKPGDTCTVHVIQAGEPKDLKIKLLAYDAEKLGSAKLIGKEPDEMAFSGFDPLVGKLGMINLPGLEKMGQLKDRVFVAPDMKQWQQHWTELQPRIADLQPQIQKSIEQALKNYQGTLKLHAGDGDEGAAGDADVEAQLDRLDKRLDQLESLLQKLVEKQQKQ